MLIKSGLRVLQSVIAISLLLLVAGQTNSQSVGAFDGLTGEYRGSRKGDNFIVWIDSSDAVEAGQQAALLLFNEQDRPRLETFSGISSTTRQNIIAGSARRLIRLNMEEITFRTTSESGIQKVG